MPLYLVRHGETRWNVEHRLQGRTDSPLTLQGLAQIRGYGALLGERLASASDVQICASPLGRTRQTASLLAEMLEVPTERCSESELLLERYCGAWEGRRHTELAELHGERVVQQQWKGWDTPIGGDGETLLQVQARARAWLDQPRAATHVVVVTHGVMSRQFRGAYLGLGPAETLALGRHTQDRIYLLDDGVVAALEVAAG